MRKLIPSLVFGILSLTVLSPACGDSTIKVGVYQNRPLLFTEDDQARGFAIDILNNIAAGEHWTLDYVPGTWPECLNRLETGEIDLLAGIAYSRTREERYDFNKETVFTNWAQVFRRKGSGIHTFLDFQGKIIGVLKGDIHYRVLQDILNRFQVECQFNEADTYDLILEMLATGQADAGVINRVYGMIHARSYDIEKTTIIFNPVEMRFATRKNRHPELLRRIDDHLKALKVDPDSLYYRYLDKWFFSDRPFQMPEWLFFGLAGLGLLFALLLGLTLLFRQQVKIRTRALSESQERYRSLADATFEAIFVFYNGSCIDTNRAATKMFGYSSREFIGMDALDLIAPVSREEAEQRLRLDSEEPCEAVAQKKDGTLFHVEIRGRMTEYKKRKVRVSVVHDIDQRKRAEQSLRESEEKYRILVENASEGISVVQDERFCWSNPRFAEMLETGAGALASRSISDFIHPDDRTMVVDRHRRRLRGEALPMHYPFRVVTGKGNHIWVELSVVRIMWEGRSATLCFFTDISERKAAADSLQRERDRIAGITETSPAGITFVNREGRIVFANTMAEEVLGLTRDEISERTYNDPAWRITDRDGHPFPKEELPFYQVMKTRKPVFGVRHGIQWPAGRRRLVSVNAAPFFDERGNMDGMVATVEDVTRQVEGEDTLRASESRMRTIIESMPVMLDAFDEEFNLIVWNDECERLTGYRREEIVNNPRAMELLYPDPDYRVRVMETFAEQAGDFRGLETELTAKSGEKKVISWSSISRQVPVPGWKTWAVGIDITAWKRAEEALKASQQNLRSLYNSMVEGVCIHEIVYDENGRAADYRITGINPAYERFTGMAKEGVEGRLATDVYGTDAPPFLELYARVAETGEPCSFETYYPPMDRHFSISAFSPETGKFATVFFDISARVLAEKEKKELEKQLRQTQKMEAIGVLAGGIAHDFNNILFPILGYSEILLESIPADHADWKSIQAIRTAALRARDLVRQILTFSRQTEKTLKPTSIPLILKEAVKLLRASLPSTIEITAEIPDRCSLVMADATQIHQIAMNLFTNAFHAMAETGGLLTVRVDEVTTGTEKDPAEPSGLPAGTYVRLRVADTGSGIEKEIIERIFDPYFTTKEKEKGTGLGLALVHGIVKSCGGDITVTSEVGRGSEFQVFLPAIEPVDAPEDVEMISSLPRGKEHILVVDDEPVVAELFEQHLQFLGYTTTVENSSLRALDTFRTDSTRFDLVITDMTMPKMTGLELSRHLKEHRADIPVLLCTGFSDTAIEQKIRDAGIDGYLMKPVLWADLARTVREILDR